MRNHNAFGLAGEAAAVKFLKKKGIKILAQNFETKFGEIDIVALQTKRSAKKQIKKITNASERAAKQLEFSEAIIVAVEVKTRRTAENFAPSDSVNFSKQNRIEALMDVFIKKMKLNNLQIRYDIIEVVGEIDNFNINHIENAF